MYHNLSYTFKQSNIFLKFMFFQNDNCEYRRSLFYEILITEITKLIPINLREGNSFVRVSITLHFVPEDNFCMSIKIKLQLFIIPINKFQITLNLFQ